MPNYPSIYLELQEIWKQIKKQEGEGISLVGPAGGILVGSYPSPHALKEPDGGGPLYVSGSMEVSGTLYVGDISSAGLSEGGDDNKTLSITTKRGFIEGTSTSTGSINIQTDAADSHIYLNTPKSLVHVRTGSGVDEGDITYGFRSQINDRPVFRTYTSNSLAGMDLYATDGTRLFLAAGEGNSVVGSSAGSLKLNTSGKVKVNISDTSVSPETNNFDLGSTTNRWNILANKINLYTSSDTQRFSIYPDSGRAIIYNANNMGSALGSAHVFNAGGDYILYIVKDNDENAIAPFTSSVTNLGELDKRWKNVYTNDINTPVATVSGSAGSLTLSTSATASVLTASSTAPEMHFVLNDIDHPDTNDKVKTALKITREREYDGLWIDTCYIEPGNYDYHYFGTTDKRWERVYTGRINTTGITVGSEGIGFIDAPDTGGSAENQNLKYYEEGTWMPVRYGDFVGTDKEAYDARYIRIGSNVQVWCSIKKTDGTTFDINSWSIGGLPFTCLSSSPAILIPSNWPSTGDYVVPAITLGSSTTIYYLKDTNGSHRSYSIYTSYITT